MGLFFAFDEFSDVENADAVRGMASVILDAFNEPTKARPDGETRIGELARQYVPY